MDTIRLFIIKDNGRSFVDVPRANLEEVQAQIEISGGRVYHASVLPKPRRRTKARLRQRVY